MTDGHQHATPTARPDNGLKFELLTTDGQARRGRVTLNHGVVETPIFMPVGTYGTVKAVQPRELEEMPAQTACRMRLSHGQGPPRAAEQPQLGVEGGTLPSRELRQSVTPCAYRIEARHLLNAARLDIQIERAQVGLGAVAVRLTVIGKVRCADRVETEAHRHDESGDNQQRPEDGSDPGHPRRWLQAASYAP